MAQANELDFFGEGTAAKPAVAAPAAAPTDPTAKAAWERANKATQPRNITTTSQASQAIGYDPGAAAKAFTGGNIGGASGAYNTVSDAGRSAYDYYRDIRDPSSVKDYMNAMGERTGVSRAGDAAIGTLGNTFQIGTPFNALDRVVDPDKGLGISGQPTTITGMTPGTRAAAGVLQGATPDTPGALGAAGVGGVGDALDAALGGPGGLDIDASGADRGGMGSHAGDLSRVQQDDAVPLGEAVGQGRVDEGDHAAVTPAARSGRRPARRAAVRSSPSAQTGRRPRFRACRCAGSSCWSSCCPPSARRWARCSTRPASKPGGRRWAKGPSSST